MYRIIDCKKAEDVSGHSIKIKWVIITQLAFTHRGPFTKSGAK